MCLSSVGRSVYLSVVPIVCRSVGRSVGLSDCLSVGMSVVDLSVGLLCLCVSAYACMSVGLSVRRTFLSVFFSRRWVHMLRTVMRTRSGAYITRFVRTFKLHTSDRQIIYKSSTDHDLDLSGQID